MAVIHLIRTDRDIVNGLVTTRPRDNGVNDSSDGSYNNTIRPRAQHVGSGATIQQWTVLDSRYKIDPTGWSS